MSKPNYKIEPSRKVAIVEVRNTGRACPSQWTGRTSDSRFIYARYRWGWLTVGIGDTVDHAVGSEDFVAKIGADLDGVLSYAQLIRATSKQFDWPVHEC